MRERLYKADPKGQDPAFTGIMDRAEQNKLLKQFEFLDGRYLIPIDGTQFFSSDTTQYIVIIAAQANIAMVVSHTITSLWVLSLYIPIKNMSSPYSRMSLFVDKMGSQKMIVN